MLMRSDVRRLLVTSRKGAVAMEYVLVAVLIAAAVAAAVVVFGRSIVAMFDVAGKGATGQVQKAGDSLSDDGGAYRSQLDKNREEAGRIADRFSDVEDAEGNSAGKDAK